MAGPMQQYKPVASRSLQKFFEPLRALLESCAFNIAVSPTFSIILEKQKLRMAQTKKSTT
jgi:hypothetical protein